MSARKPLIAGNWKMFGLGADLSEIVALQAVLGTGGGVDVVVCPPATLVARAAEALARTSFGLGAQDCHPDREGAHTGDVSAPMLAEAGATWVILGHSERRRDHRESDELVARKVEAAAAAGLTAIVCVGETAEERKAGREQAVVGAQLAQSLPGARPAGLVIAYEPVWAIGTGVTPTLDEIAAMHAFIRKALPDGENVRLLYGGSVKPQNARDIFATANVDGALVGGASLKAADFSAIIRAHPVFSVRTGN